MDQWIVGTGEIDVKKEGFVGFALQESQGSVGDVFVAQCGEPDSFGQVGDSLCILECPVPVSGEGPSLSAKNDFPFFPSAPSATE